MRGSGGNSNSSNITSESKVVSALFCAGSDSSSNSSSLIEILEIPQESDIRLEELEEESEPNIDIENLGFPDSLYLYLVLTLLPIPQALYPTPVGFPDSLYLYLVLTLPPIPQALYPTPAG